MRKEDDIVTGWGTEHEASRYRQIHHEVEEMGGWANYRHFMTKKRYIDRKEFTKMKEDLEAANKKIELLEHKLKIVIENGLGPEDLKPQDV